MLKKTLKSQITKRGLRFYNTPETNLNENYEEYEEEGEDDDDDEEEEEDEYNNLENAKNILPNGIVISKKMKPSKEAIKKKKKKTKGRVKIQMEFIENKIRRYTTFSKRKTGIMKKAYELSTLTGTQVMLLVASETGHVYTFATDKLQPMITSDAGKSLIQSCLNFNSNNDGEVCNPAQSLIKKSNEDNSLDQKDINNQKKETVEIYDRSDNNILDFNHYNNELKTVKKSDSNDIRISSNKSIKKESDRKTNISNKKVNNFLENQEIGHDSNNLKLPNNNNNDNILINSASNLDYFSQLDTSFYLNNSQKIKQSKFGY